jgi:tetratricopeptide (TPR) repeat protein
LFILVPLILTPWNYELFEFNKMVVTYTITAIIFGAWCIQSLADKKISIRKTPLDIPILLFVASQLVSALFSMDPHVSWFGYYSRFNGGMWSIFTYVVLYYAFVTHFNTALQGSVKKLLAVIVAIAAVVSVYGVAEHFGIDKNLWVQDVQSRVFSTLGQPNWLAAYLVAIIPLMFALLLQSKKTISIIICSLCSILFFIVLLFTRSRSGYLGLAVADVLFWGCIFFPKKLSFKVPQSSALTAFLICHIAFAIIVFFNGTYVEQIDKWVTLASWRDRITHVVTPQPKPAGLPAQAGTALDEGGTDSGIIRKYVWEGAISAWRANTKNMLVGTGTETFAFAFYQYRPAGHNMTSEWDFLYNKAHNEYLNYLATTGAIGLGTYLLIIGVFIYWFIRSKKTTISVALFAGWVSILVTNFLGFSVVIIQLMFFLFPAIIITESNELKIANWKLKISLWFSLIPFLLSLTALIFLYRYWKADTYYALGYNDARLSRFQDAETYDMQAIAINPNEPTYHDELATTLGSLVLAAVDAKDATTAANLAKQSLAENDISLKISPKNVTFWKTRTKLYYSFSAFDPTLNQAAISALETAQTLSPNDPKIVYNLAILYGRQGDNNKAVQLLQHAKVLKPDYRDAYFGLYVFYTEMKEPNAAKAELQYYLTHVDPNDKDFQDRLKQQ